MNSKELWPFLFLVGALLFNWPFLDIFSVSLPYYLFGVWGIFILIVGVFMTVIRKKKNGNDVYGLVIISFHSDLSQLPFFNRILR